MKQVTEVFKSVINTSPREIHAKIIIDNERELTSEEIVSISLNQELCQSEIMLGTTNSASLEVELLRDDSLKYKKLELFFGITLPSNEIEFVKMGEFYSDEIVNSKLTTSISAFDKFIKTEVPFKLELNEYPASVEQVIHAIKETYDITIIGAKQSSINNFEFETLREFIGYIAQLSGGFAVCNADGVIEIKRISDTVYKRIDGSSFYTLTREDFEHNISKLICYVEEESEDSANSGFEYGEETENGFEMIFENKDMTQNILDEIGTYYTKAELGFIPLSLEWQGDFSLELGDMIEIEDLDGTILRTPILMNNYEYAGSLKCSTSSLVNRKDKQDFSSNGSITSQVKRVVKEQNLIKSEIIHTNEKWQAIFSDSGRRNLIKNGEFANKLDSWEVIGSPTTRVAISGETGFSHSCLITTTESNQYIEQSIDFLALDKQYTASIYMRSQEEGVAGVLEIVNGDEVLNVTSDKKAQWQYLTITFTTKSRDVKFRIGKTTAGTIGGAFYTGAMLQEGEERTAWISNENEIFEGVTSINGDGISIAHSNIGTTTQMSADGFFIYDHNNETIANLSAEDMFSELKVNSVKADNINYIYDGLINVYVDTTKETGEGTVDNPFGSLEEALAYFETKGKIINKTVNINLLNEIHGEFEFSGFSGTGVLNVKLASSDKLQYLYFNVNNNSLPMAFVGSRTNGNNTGASIKRRTAQTYVFEIRDCAYVGINGFRTVGQQGSSDYFIYSSRSKVYPVNNDISKYHGAFYVDLLSHVLSNNNVGSSLTYVARVLSGGILSIANSVPNCSSSTIANLSSGIYSEYSIKKTASLFTEPTTPATSVQTKTFTNTDFGYYTTNTGKWNSIGQFVYQGNIGYGNHKGFITFDDASIRNWLSDATNITGSITIKRANNGGVNKAQKVILCGSTTTTLGAGTPTNLTTYHDLGSLNWGETKTFKLPQTVANAFKSGVVKSLCFYDETGKNYIKFGNTFKLTLKATKTA